MDRSVKTDEGYPFPVSMVRAKRAMSIPSNVFDMSSDPDYAPAGVVELYSPSHLTNKNTRVGGLVVAFRSPT